MSLLKIGMVVVLVALLIGAVVMYMPSSANPKSKDMTERLKAVSQLVGSKDEGSLETLDELATDKEVRVAKAAIRAIGSRQDEASRKKLEKIVSENKNGVLCGTAAAELGNYEKTSVTTLTEILLKDKRPEARAGAAEGLKRLHNYASRDAIIKALSDPDASTRQNAFEALGAMTAKLFEFNSAADPKTQVENIKEIKRAIASHKYVHGAPGLGK